MRDLAYKGGVRRSKIRQFTLGSRSTPRRNAEEMVTTLSSRSDVEASVEGDFQSHELGGSWN